VTYLCLHHRLEEETTTKKTEEAVWRYVDQGHHPATLAPVHTCEVLCSPGDCVFKGLVVPSISLSKRMDVTFGSRDMSVSVL